ncbi:hypothetical protein HS088_TW19G00005 [Tripterygium wilfordii]|uniref:F-box/LRR-repeat protein 15-like leucin rich repeat domain-containing protein n=1 Tax=Tripterygium wilfordii TaxID=458696 RepID=A0A7J7C9J7_TRIWF|nr:F-box protein At-B-like [Tripterygium wilfordii]KAF5730416.1 hypothetical protein HS088_TW19G00005 [Tripterygium wilfordii]
MEGLPTNLITEGILLKLGLETLCSIACVNRSLRFSVDSQVLPFLSSLDLSAITPDEQTLHFILSRCCGLRSVSINCRLLYDSSLFLLLGPNLRELNLLCCSFISYEFLAHIGQRCPNLRMIMLQLVAKDSLDVFRTNLAKMLSSCSYLESLCLKIRGIEVSDFKSIEFSLPRTIKTLKLNPVLEHHAFQLINEMRVGGNSSNQNDFSIPVLPSSCDFTLSSLSLVLNVISDRLLRTITNFFPLLVELDLEDRPNKEPLPYHDLTNNGLQSLSSCRRLTALSIIRSRQNHQVSFKRINDMGMFLLSEGCRGLESVRLCGFSKVSDAGFASILYSSLNSKKFEVRNALLLSDLAFHDLAGSPCALVEVRLLSCSLITSEAVKKLAYSRSLEMLDLCGCKSIADSCLSSISRLHKLKILNLTGADITDSGLSVLGRGSTPITHLCLRSCKRVTDKGISHLVHSGGIIRQTLSTLDLGHMPGISDKAILTIAKACRELTELCIRNCFHVTDSSMQALATNGESPYWSRRLRRLDMSNCIGVSVDSLRFLRRPCFRRLHWLGIGRTRLASKQNAFLTEICKERPWLCICLDGCEIGCHDGWHFHRSETH